MHASEWTRTNGPTNAPSAHQEADVQEFGRRVAHHDGDQSVLGDDPADSA